jgi:hypothetical protein
LPPDPDYCDELPESTPTYTGVYRVDEEGKIQLHVSRPESTCEELVGCADVLDGDYLELRLASWVNEVGGYPIEDWDFEAAMDAPIQASCGGCFLADGNEAGEGGPTLGGHLELIRFTDQDIRGCVTDMGVCDAVRFVATRCD